MRPWLLAAATALWVARPLYPSEAAAAHGDGLPVVMLWLALAVCWLFSVAGQRRFSLRFGWTDAAAGLLIALCAAAALWAVRHESPRPALNMLWEWTGLGLGFFLTRQLLGGAGEGAGDGRRDDRPGRRALRLWPVSAERRDAAGRGGVQTGSRRHGARRRRVGARRFAPATAPRRPSEKPGADGHLRPDQLAGRDVGPLVGDGHRDRGELFHAAQGRARASSRRCSLPRAWR